MKISNKMIQDSLLDNFDAQKEPKNLNAILYAPFGRRAVAAIVDLIILGLFLIMWFALSGLLILLLGLGLVTVISDISVNMLYGMIDITFLFLGVLGIFFIPIFYFIRGETSPAQATFGKVLMNLQVVDMEYERLTVRQAAKRLFLACLSTAFCLIGYIPALFTQKRQTFHDLVAKTLVVKKI